MASGSGRGRHALQFRKECVRLDAGEANAEGVGQSPVGVAVEPEPGNRSGKPVPKKIAHLLCVARARFEFATGQGRGRAEADDAEDVFRARAKTVLVPRPMHEFLQPRAGPDIQGADALGSVELVTGNRQEVDPELADIDGNLADRLGGVAVEKDAGPMRDRREFRNRLNCAYLVVGVHHRHEDGVGRDRLFQIGGVDHSIPVDGEECRAKTLGFQPMEHFDDRGVLDGARYHVSAPVPPREGRALDGEIVRLAAAAREHDILAPGSDEDRDARPRLLDGPPRLDAEAMRG